MSKSIVSAEQVINRFISEEGVKFDQERDDWMLDAMAEYASQFKESQPTEVCRTNWELEAKKAWRKIEIYKEEADRYKNALAQQPTEVERMSEIGIWLQNQLRFFTSIEGEITKVSDYAGGLSIKFKNGNGYTLKLSKQCDIVTDEFPREDTTTRRG
jgi:hypothetical protein